MHSIIDHCQRYAQLIRAINTSASRRRPPIFEYQFLGENKPKLIDFLQWNRLIVKIKPYTIKRKKSRFNWKKKQKNKTKWNALFRIKNLKKNHTPQNTKSVMEKCCGLLTFNWWRWKQTDPNGTIQFDGHYWKRNEIADGGQTDRSR